MASNRLRAKAARLGANAVVDIEISVVVNGPKSPCWKRTIAKGTAVTLLPAASVALDPGRVAG